MKNVFYTVVELAGYDGENDRQSGFKTAYDAWEWAEKHYSPHELDRLHVDVRMDPDETYDF
jgi:hypothetical protein